MINVVNQTTTSGWPVALAYSNGRLSRLCDIDTFAMPANFQSYMFPFCRSTRSDQSWLASKVYSRHEVGIFLVRYVDCDLSEVLMLGCDSLECSDDLLNGPRIGPKYHIFELRRFREVDQNQRRRLT